MARTLYDVIGVSSTATQAEIEAACLALGKRHNPENNPNDWIASDRFSEIERAYETLGDPKLRAAYDSGNGIPRLTPLFRIAAASNLTQWILARWKWFVVVPVSLIALFWLGNFLITYEPRQELRNRKIDFTPENLVLKINEPETVKLFLKAGMPPDSSPKGYGGYTPLMAAALSLNLESMRLLLDAGANVNAQSPTGTTPLFNALFGLRSSLTAAPEAETATKKVHNLRVVLPAVQLLLDRGADPSLGSEGDLPISYLLWLGLYEKDTGAAAVVNLVTDALKKRSVTGPIRPECTVNGLGRVTCTFRNVGSTEAGSCFVVRLVARRYHPNCLIPPISGSLHDRCEGVKAFIEGGPICSGLVRPQDVRQLTQSVAFQGLGTERDVAEWCKGNREDYSNNDWRTGCDIRVIRAE